MLTRLRVSGFKNFDDVEVRFGPLTCIAGDNGIGKSNLFDAVQLLSDLTYLTATEAAHAVRDREKRSTDIGAVFGRSSQDGRRSIHFKADLIVPGLGVDEFGQQVKASHTFLQYALVLSLVPGDGSGWNDQIEVAHEELTYVRKGDAASRLGFEHSPAWLNSVVVAKRSTPFISTKSDADKTVIRLHQEGKQGRPREFNAERLQRTILSAANAETPTALLAKHELQSWRQLQLEPTAMRRADRFSDPPRIGTDGAHVAATLRRLGARGGDPARVYAEVADRVSELVGDIREVSVEVDERRELYYATVEDSTGAVHEARSLSDGTLRFLTLAVMEQDPDAAGLLRFEEPENGIHPARIGAMLRLLADIAVDPQEPVDESNPLRQVIVNTHSPVVVGAVADEDLLYAEPVTVKRPGGDLLAVRFKWLEGTWRSRQDPDLPTVTRGKLAPFLNPQADASDDGTDEPPAEAAPDSPRRTRVRERQDLRQLALPLGAESVV